VKFGIDLILTTLSKTSKQIGILVLSVVLTRYLSKTEYGTYLHVQLIANVAIWSFMLGIPHSIYYFLPKVREQRRLILSTLAMVLTIAALVTLAIVLSGDSLAKLLNNPDLVTLLGLTALITFFQIPLAIFEPVLIAADRVRTFIRWDALFNVSFFLVVFIPAVLTGDVYPILLALCWYHAVQLTVVLLVLIQTALRYDNHSNPEKEAYLVKDQLHYSFPIGLSQGIFELARYGDKIIVSHFFNPEVLAVYARGAMDIPLLNIINNTIDNLMMPQLIEAFKDGSANNLLKLWHDTIALTASFMYPSFFFLVYTAPYLIPGLYGEEYRDAVLIFQIYSCGILFRVSTYNVIVRVIGKTKMMAWVASASETANILGTILLVQLYGILGAPAATVVASGVIVAGYLWGIGRDLDVKIRDIFPWRRLMHICTLAALALLPLVLVSTMLTDDFGNWATIGIMAPIYTVSFWVLMRFVPVLSDYQRELLRMMLPGRLKWLV